MNQSSTLYAVCTTDSRLTCNLIVDNRKKYLMSCWNTYYSKMLSEQTDDRQQWNHKCERLKLQMRRNILTAMLCHSVTRRVHLWVSACMMLAAVQTTPGHFVALPSVGLPNRVVCDASCDTVVVCEVAMRKISLANAVFSESTVKIMSVCPRHKSFTLGRFYVRHFNSFSAFKCT